MESYNLAIDTGVYGINGAIELIKKAVETKENTSIHQIYEEPFYSSSST